MPPLPLGPHQTPVCSLAKCNCRRIISAMESSGHWAEAFSHPGLYKGPPALNCGLPARAVEGAAEGACREPGLGRELVLSVGVHRGVHPEPLLSSWHRKSAVSICKHKKHFIFLYSAKTGNRNLDVSQGHALLRNLFSHQIPLQKLFYS